MSLGFLKFLDGFIAELHEDFPSILDVHGSVLGATLLGLGDGPAG